VSDYDVIVHGGGGALGEPCTAALPEPGPRGAVAER
jgi:hypothetical protein